MREYGKVHSSFWSSPTIRSMSEDGRMMALYLMTCPHNTIAGVFRLPDGYVCEDLEWTPERVSAALKETVDKGFANRCETTKWVWIRKHLEWNPPENPNQKKSAAKIVQSIPNECTWRADFIGVSSESIGLQPTQNANPSETVEKPFLNQKQEQEQKQKKDKGPRFALPAWVPSDVWQAFEEHRQRLRKPMTDRARVLMLRELEKLRPADPGAVLEQSIRKGWQDVFPLKETPSERVRVDA